MSGRAVQRALMVSAMFAGLATFDASACEPIAERAELRDGVYCLSADVSLDSLPFYIYDNTTLNCQGRRITDAPAAIGSAVIAWGDNVVVKNCVIDGFHSQLRFMDTTNYRIEDNLLVNGRSLAINASGSQGLIARNTIRSPLEGHWRAVLSRGADIVDNTIIRGKREPSIPPATWSGIHSSGGGVIAHNLVMAVTNPEEGGQFIASYGYPLVVYRNVLVATPGSYSVGLLCSDSPYDTTEIYLQNVFLGFLSYPNTDENCAGDFQSG